LYEAEVTCLQRPLAVALHLRDIPLAQLPFDDLDQNIAMDGDLIRVKL